MFFLADEHGSRIGVTSGARGRAGDRRDRRADSHGRRAGRLLEAGGWRFNTGVHGARRSTSARSPPAAARGRGARRRVQRGPADPAVGARRGDLASKALLERLDPEDAAAVGLEPQRMTYTTVAELPHAARRRCATRGRLRSRAAAAVGEARRGPERPGASPWARPAPCRRRTSWLPPPGSARK